MPLRPKHWGHKIMKIRMGGGIDIPTIQHYQFIYSLQIYDNFIPVFENYRLETHT